MPLWFYSDTGKVTSSFVDAQTNSAGASSSFTFSGLNFGAAAADRQIAVCVMWQSGTPFKSLTSATIGGVTASILVQTASNGLNCAIIEASVPTGTSGSVVVNFSGSTVIDISVAVYALTGANSVSATATSAVNPASATLNVPTGGAVIGCAANSSTGSSTVAWSGITVDSSQHPFTTYLETSASGDFASANPSLAVSATFSPATQTDGCFAVFSP